MLLFALLLRHFVTISFHLDGRDDFIPAQFVRQPVKVPWKAVLYAVILLFLGSCLLIAGCLIGKYPLQKDFLYAVILLFLGSCLLIAGCLIGNNLLQKDYLYAVILLFLGSCFS